MNAASDTLRRRIEAAGDGRLTVCSVVRAELFFGALKSQSPEKSLTALRDFLSRFVSYSFDDMAAIEYARIRAELERRGTPIGANDLMIAAIATRNSLTLVTHNVGEFRRVSGLSVEDWETG